MAFFLRSQLRWHFGDPIDSKQLMKTLDRLRHNPCSQPSFANVVDISLPHALCLEFTLSYPDYWLAHRLADLHCRLFHPEAAHIGAGPFKLAKFSPHFVRLEQHEFYHLQHPHLETIEYWITPGALTPPTHGSCHHPIRISIGEKEELPSAQPVQSRMSSGFCYLAINHRRHSLSQSQIINLLMLVQTAGILKKLPSLNGIMRPCTEMLPGWPIPQFQANDDSSLPENLTLVYRPPVELANIANELKSLLADHNCKLDIAYCHDKKWQDMSQLRDADLLLADHLVDEAPEATMESWLRHDQLWQAILADQQQAALQKVLLHIQQIECLSERFKQLACYYHQFNVDRLYFASI